MPTVTDFHLRTSESAGDAERSFREQLRARGVDPERYWISFRPANDEDRESGLRDFGLLPTVSASVQPPRGQTDGELDAAILATAHGFGAELVVFQTDTPLFSYKDGVAHLSSEDREYYEKYVLPGFTGQVDYDELLPWLAGGSGSGST